MAAAGARVLKDSDFVRLYPRGVCVATSTSELKALQDRVEADVSFFRGEGIMDYSLLLGVGTPVDGDNPPVVIGIIDYLQVPVCVCSGCSSSPTRLRGLHVHSVTMFGNGWSAGSSPSCTLLWIWTSVQ